MTSPTEGNIREVNVKMISKVNKHCTASGWRELLTYTASNSKKNLALLSNSLTMFTYLGQNTSDKILPCNKQSIYWKIVWIIIFDILEPANHKFWQHWYSVKAQNKIKYVTVTTSRASCCSQFFESCIFIFPFRPMPFVQKLISITCPASMANTIQNKYSNKKIT
jgi:hypothetical protein